MDRRRLIVGFFALAIALSSCNNRNAERVVAESAVDASAHELVAGQDELLYVLPSKSESTHPRRRQIADPIVLTDCRLTIPNKQDVPSQLDGVLLAIGRELNEEETVPPDRLVVVNQGERVRRFYRWREDDIVAAGEQLGQLDDRKARDEFAIKDSKVAAGQADLAASEKTRDEAKARYDRQLRLRTGGIIATSEEEVRSAKLNWDCYFFEARSKSEAVKLAERERNQAKTVQEQHEVRSAIPGIIKAIHKKRGEAVKAMEPVFQIYDLSKLRAEGVVDLEFRSRLRKGMTAVVEPTRLEGPEQTLVGHLQEVTAVAVSKDPKRPLIVSASEDGAVHIWDRSVRSDSRVLPHPMAVRAVACTPPGASADWCLTGCGDSIARLWNLASNEERPIRQLKGGHKGAISCVAFSPDGKSCATGGEDRETCIWDTATGELRYRLPPGHRGAITSVQFTPDSRLITSSRDHTVRLWELHRQSAVLLTSVDRRSGDVAWPGVSPDGRSLLLDQGKVLRMPRFQRNAPRTSSKTRGKRPPSRRSRCSRVMDD